MRHQRDTLTIPIKVAGKEVLSVTDYIDRPVPFGVLPIDQGTLQIINFFDKCQL
jgi:hypothetical protein